MSTQRQRYILYIPLHTAPSFGGFMPWPFLILLLSTLPSLFSDTSSPVTTNVASLRISNITVIHVWVTVCDTGDSSSIRKLLSAPYSMRQIINSVCLCQCTSLSVCPNSHGHISPSIFTKSGTEVTTPKGKNEFVGGQHRHHSFTYFAPKNPPFSSMNRCFPA